MRILILSVVFLASAAASVPIRDGCSEDSAVVADVQDSDPIQVRHGVLGETLPCYAVSVTQAGKELRGFILGSSLPKPKSAQSIAGRPVDTDDDGLADIIKRARPALERARELYGH